ncbi:MAG: group II intron reverse transcriptase/maturase, partial [bacterium]|nr:group II intron reverse transcriptase/maturase [bacterium]
HPRLPDDALLAREFRRMKAEVLANFQLHSVDLREETRGRCVINRRILLRFAEYGNLLLKLRNTLQRDGQLPVVCNHAHSPQGSPLSPLLANILLDDLDRELERRGHRFARYADDLLILVRSVRAGDRVKASVTRYLTSQLKLKVNESKSRVCGLNEVVFLGFTFRGTKLRWSDASFAKFKHRVRRLTGRSWGVSMDYRLHKLAEYVCGWMNYYGISDYYRPVPEIDKWIRRRIRMCYWKRWRFARTKVRHLLALGTSKRQAIFTAISRKSYWHLSKTLATQTGMTNKWLQRQGLISVRD